MACGTPVKAGSHDRTTPPRRHHSTALRLRAWSGSGSATSTGLILCAEHYGAPYDLLAAALGAQPARLRAITARWRRAGYAATGRLGPGPGWCWLTPAGMAAAGFGYRAGPPVAGPAGAHPRRARRPALAVGLPGLGQGRPGGIRSGASAPPARPARPPPGTCPTPRSTGPASMPARTRARCGRSKSS